MIIKDEKMLLAIGSISLTLSILIDPLQINCFGFSILDFIRGMSDFPSIPTGKITIGSNVVFKNVWITCELKSVITRVFNLKETNCRRKFWIVCPTSRCTY